MMKRIISVRFWLHTLLRLKLGISLRLLPGHYRQQALCVAQCLERRQKQCALPGLPLPGLINTRFADKNRIVLGAAVLNGTANLFDATSQLDRAALRARHPGHVATVLLQARPNCALRPEAVTRSSPRSRCRPSSTR